MVELCIVDPPLSSALSHAIPTSSHFSFSSVSTLHPAWPSQPWEADMKTWVFQIVPNKRFQDSCLNVISIPLCEYTTICLSVYFVDGNLDDFQSVAIRNKTAINICV